MNRTIFILLALSLTGCTAEVAGTAATVAESRAKEAEEAKKTKARVEQQLEAANQAIQQKANDAERQMNQ